MAQSTPYDRTSASSVPPTTDRDEESTGGLLRRLFDELATLFRQEIALARSELSSSISTAKAGIGSVAAGGAVLFCGVLVLLAAVVLLLGEVMELWLSALIVGAIVAIVGYSMLRAGQRRLQTTSLMPDRTQESLRKDKEMVQQRRTS